MIRVYSSNFTREEYLRMAEMFRAGVKAFCDCGYTSCSDCDCRHVCTSFLKASIHCERKAAEMVES